MSDDQGTTHVVSDCETILSIAHDHGFRAWETIWDHAKNAELKKRRKDPTILAPGDEVFVPPKEPKKETAETEKLNPYWVRRLGARLRFVVRYESGRKAKNTLYCLAVDDKEYEGRTDDDGVIDIEIHPKARRGRLTVWYDEDDPAARLTWEIAVGGMTPADTIPGMKARLNHLGFDAGPTTSVLDEQAIAALRAFQDLVGLDVTGEPDQKTTEALDFIQNAK